MGPNGPKCEYKSINLPIWNDKNLKKRVLIVDEQGMGDTFQFFRFIIQLKNKFMGGAGETTPDFFFFKS